MIARMSFIISPRASPILRNRLNNGERSINPVFASSRCLCARGRQAKVLLRGKRARDETGNLFIWRVEQEMNKCAWGWLFWRNHRGEQPREVDKARLQRA